jgi:hypothetical protein
MKRSRESPAIWPPGSLRITKLGLLEIAQVIGAAAEIRVSEVVDHNAVLILKLKKTYLQTLTPAK